MEVQSNVMNLLHETGMYIVLIYGQWYLIQNSEYSMNNSMWIAVDNSADGFETRLITEYVER